MPNTLEIEERDGKRTNKGVFVSRGQIILAIVLVFVVFAIFIAASVLITYFAKPDKEIDEGKVCQDLFCQNATLTQLWTNECSRRTSTTPAPTTPATVSTTAAAVTTIVTTVTTQTTTPASTQPPSGSDTSSTLLESTTTADEDPIDYRLPRDLQPKLYDLSVQPFFKLGEVPQFYDANLTITFTCVKQTNKLILHMNNLDIVRSSLIVKSTTDAQFGEFSNFAFTYDSVTNFFTAVFSQPFKPNQNYEFSVMFRGYTNTDERGFYRTYYTNDKGERTWVIASQLEHLHGRKAFISFDEPGFKAVFRTTIIHDKSLTSRSNNVLKSSEPYGESDGYEWIKDEYEDSPIMPTYLLAILISDFSCKTEKTTATIPSTPSVEINVCGRDNAKEFFDLPLEMSVKTLEYFESYLEYPYTLTKLDHVATSAFKGGAMENWGLATYRESYFITNDRVNEPLNENSMLTVIAHETSHMWFGNLVTCAWWDDLWINEGFARYFQYLASHPVRPDWRMMEQLFQTMVSTLQLDSNENYRALSQPVIRPDEVTANPSYGKGGGIVRILHHALGEETFRKGLNNFLKKHSFTNPSRQDLWACLEEVARSERKLEGVDFSAAMEAWCLHRGHPVVHVRSVNNTHVTIEQNRFLLDINYPRENLKNYTWTIPFAYSIESNTQVQGVDDVNSLNADTTNIFDKITWIDSDTTLLKLKRPVEKNEFILANLNMFGFYRVNYDNKNWEAIIEQLHRNPFKLSVITRAQLINDAFSLSQAGYINANYPLGIMKYLSKETDYLPWNVLLNEGGFTYVQNVLESLSEFRDFKSIVAGLVEAYYIKLGWEEKQSDGWMDKVVRRSIVDLACQMDHPACIQQAQKYFSDWTSDPAKINDIPLNLRSIAYCTAIRNGYQAEFDFLFNKLNQEESGTKNRADFLLGLSCTSDPFTLNRFLNDRFKNSRDIVTVLGNRLSKAFSLEPEWEFIKFNWDDLYKEYTMTGLVNQLSNKLNTDKQYNEFKNFFDSKMPLAASLSSSVQASLRKIRGNVNWMIRNKRAVVNWIDQNRHSIVQKDYRLPKDLTPTLYEMTLKPYFKVETMPEYYDTTLDLHFTCVSQTNKLVLHMKNLQINNSSLKITSSTDSQFKEVKEFPWSHDVEADFFIAEFPTNPFRPGNSYTFSIEFRGFLLSDERGFYRTYYNDSNGNQRWAIASQLQHLHGRKAFISFDEPGFKAVFRTTIIHDVSVIAQTNNELKSSEFIGQSDGYDWQKDVFEDTPPMQTYLVAIVLSDYICKSELYRGAVNMTACGRPTAGEQSLQLPLEAAILSLEYFEKYLNIEYNLPKLEHVATSQFKGGAMENWGLVAYRENILIGRDDKEDPLNEFVMVTIVSHETSHMWFGNLITCQWWDDLWINEGFAQYYEFTGAVYMRPTWRLYDQLVYETTRSLQEDSFEESRAISQAVITPDEVTANPSYTKGSGVVRIMHYVLGEEAYRKGLNNFFTKFSYKNPSRMDLWKSLEETAKSQGGLVGVDFPSIMEKWSLDRGHPVVHVKILNKTHISLEQNRFLLDSNYPKESLNNNLWPVPFTYSIESIKSDVPKTELSTLLANETNLYDKITWFNTDKAVLKLSAPIEDGDFLVANLEMFGFYRVNYDSKNWDALNTQLKDNHEKLSARTRLQLVSDVFSLCQGGYLDVSYPLNLISYMTKEFDYLPWYGLINGRVELFQNGLDLTKYFLPYKTYMARLITPYYRKLGWTQTNTNEDWSDSFIRKDVVDFACRMDVSECVQTARKYYEDFMKTPTSNPIPVSSRSTAYCVGIRYGFESEFEFLFNQLKANTEVVPRAKARTDLMLGLTCSRDHLSLLRLFNDRLENSRDIVTVLQYATTRSSSYLFVWDYIKLNWERLYQEYSFAELRGLLNVVAKRLNTESLLNDFNRFFDGQRLSEAYQNQIAINIKTIKANVNWLNKNDEFLNAWTQP